MKEIKTDRIIEIIKNKKTCEQYMSDDEWKSNKIENQVRFLKSFSYFQIIQSEEEWIRSGEKINKKN